MEEAVQYVLFQDRETEYERERKQRKRDYRLRLRFLRDSSNPFTLPDKVFYDTYR